MEDFWLKAFMILLVLVCVILIGGVGYLIYRRSADCTARGGTMVGTGHYSTIYVKAGTVLVPIRVEDTKCSE